MEDREKEIQGVERRAACKKLNEGEDKEKLEGEHRETRRRERKKWVNDINKEQ